MRWQLKRRSKWLNALIRIIWFFSFCIDHLEASFGQCFLADLWANSFVVQELLTQCASIPSILIVNSSWKNFCHNGNWSVQSFHAFVHYLKPFTFLEYIWNDNFDQYLQGQCQNTNPLSKLWRSTVGWEVIYRLYLHEVLNDTWGILFYFCFIFQLPTTTGSISHANISQ